MSTLSRLVFLHVVVFVGMIQVANGQQVLMPENFNQSTNPQLFGAGMDFSDGVLAISGPFGRPTGGSCSLFEFDGNEWVVQQLIPGSRGSFGRDVAIEGEWLAIGTPSFNTVSVYRRLGVTWTFFQELLPTSAGVPGNYGDQVVIDNGLLFVCDPTFNSPSTIVGSDGSIFVYEFNGLTWIETSVIAETTNGPGSTGFGRAIDIDGNRLAVGAGGIETFIFEQNLGTWELIEAVVNPVGSLPGVSIDGDRAVFAGSQIASNTGIAFVYEFDGVTWSEVAELSDPNGQPGDFFGSSVSVCGDDVFVGAMGCDDERGKLFHFRRAGNDWVLQPSAPTPATPLQPNDFFGAGLLISPPWTFVSAPRVDGPLSIDVGAVFAFTPSNFVRGDVNGNGSFQSLSDVIYLLNFQFAGGPSPLCDDAADVDDNGFVSGLLDALYILNASFVAGSPPIPAPNTCGVDSTDDGLGCTTSTCP